MRGAVRAAGAALALILASCASAVPGHGAGGIRVGYDTWHPLGTLAPNAIGLSFEYSNLTSGELSAPSNLGDLLSALGPGVLRIGAAGLDKRPSRLDDPELVAALARTVRAAGWTVLYGIDLGHFDPAIAARNAAQATQAFGSSLAGIACGNEPDAYYKRLRPADYDVAAYLRDATACLDAVHAAAPSAPLVGPDSATSPWLAPYARAMQGRVGTLTTHVYAISGCQGRAPPDPADLLARATADKVDAEIDAAAAAAGMLGGILRLDEANSVSCGGAPGISNAYVSALWAADFVLRSAEHGAQGVNLHGGTHDVACDGYSPLCLASPGTFRPAPVYSGLLLAHLLGSGTLIATTASATGLTAHGVLAGDGTVRLLVENVGRTARRVAVPAARSASFWTMVAPGGLSATSGITIQGAAAPALGAPGRLVASGGYVSVTLPPLSATVVRIAPR